MATRTVTATRKDRNGDITALGNFGELWSPRLAPDAIDDIVEKRHAYWVNWPDGLRTEVRVVRGSTGPYLRTDRDDTTHNNLDDLPDC